MLTTTLWDSTFYPSFISKQLKVRSFSNLFNVPQVASDESIIEAWFYYLANVCFNHYFKFFQNKLNVNILYTSQVLHGQYQKFILQIMKKMTFWKSIIQNYEDWVSNIRTGIVCLLIKFNYSVLNLFYLSALYFSDYSIQVSWG